MNKFYIPVKIAVCMFLILLLSVILQMSLSNFIEIAYISPNVLVIVVSASGFLIGKKSGILMGFFAGFFIDFLGSDLFGFSSIVFMMIGYISGNLKRLLFIDKYWISLIVIGISDIFYGFCNFIFLFLLRGRINLFYYLKRIILSEAVYTVVIATVLYPLFKSLLVKIEKLIIDYNSKR